MRSGVVDSGHSHKKLNIRVGKGLVDDQRIDCVALALQRGEQVKVDVDQGSVERIKLNVCEPVEPLAAEKVPGWWGHEPRAEHRVDPVANARALVDHRGSPAAIARLSSTSGVGTQTLGR